MPDRDEAARRVQRASRRDVASSDVEQTPAWCDACAEVTEWRKSVVDVSRSEEASGMPDVERAVEGDPGWVCMGCGAFREDLVADEAYDYELTDRGYRVEAFSDDAEVEDEVVDEGVSPPPASAEVVPKGGDEGGLPADWESDRKGRDR